MAKVFEIDFRNGSSLETVSKVYPIDTNMSILKTKKGYTAKSYQQGYYTYANPESLNFGTSEFSYVIALKVLPFNHIGSLVNAIMGNGNVLNSATLGIEMRATNSLRFLIGNGLTLDQLLDPEVINLDFNLYYFERTSSNVINLYKNNLLIDTGSSTKNVTTTNNFYLFDDEVISRISNSEIVYIKFFDKALTSEERIGEFNLFNSSYPTKEVNRPFYGDKRVTDLSKEVRNVLGDNVVVNGTFEDSSNWIIAGESEINNGSARIYSSAGANSGVGQNNKLIVGKYYILNYEVIEYISGGIIFQDGVNNISLNSELGVHSIEFIAGGLTFYFIRGGLADVRIDNVVIQEQLGLVLAYNMKPFNGLLPDISGNGWDGIVSNLTETPNGLENNLSLADIQFGWININQNIDYTVWSVNFRLKAYALNTTVFIGKGTLSSIYYYSGTLNFRTADSVFHSLSFSLDLNKYYNISIISDGTDIYLYVDGYLKSTITPSETIIAFNKMGEETTGTILIGEWVDIRCYDRVLTLDEIRSYNDLWEERITLKDNFDDDIVSGEISGWKVGTGIFKAGEEVITETWVPTSIFNGGGSGTSDWINPDVYGIAEGWMTVIPGELPIYSFRLYSVTTSVGFTGNVQRAESLDILPTGLVCDEFVVDPNMLYTLRFKYKSTYPSIDITIFYRTGPGLTGIILLENKNVIPSGSITDESLEFFCADGQENLIIRVRCSEVVSAGEYLEIDEVYLDKLVYESTLFPPEIDLSNYISQYKYIQCLTAGTISTQSEEAYGTWEFDVYKTETSTALFHFISSGKDYSGSTRYNIVLYNDESIGLMRDITVLFRTDVTYIDSEVWYRIKITRDIVGKFYVYIKGGDLGSMYTIVDVTGGSGTNPVVDNTYTTSKYIFLDIEAGDRFRALKKTGLTTITSNNVLSAFFNLTT